MTKQGHRIIKAINRVQELYPQYCFEHLVTIAADNSYETIGISSAGKNKYHLTYNPKFVRKHSDKMLRSLLVHEAKHIDFKHLERMHFMLGIINAESCISAFNDAADLEVNQTMPALLPKGAYYPGEGQFKRYPKGRFAEEYFIMLLQDLIVQMRKKNKQLMKGAGVRRL